MVDLACRAHPDGAGGRLKVGAAARHSRGELAPAALFRTHEAQARGQPESDAGFIIVVALHQHGGARSDLEANQVEGIGMPRRVRCETQVPANASTAGAPAAG